MTFGGFIGLATFLPTYYYDQFPVSKVQASQLSMLAAFMGAARRVFGWISDRWGGIITLTVALAMLVMLRVMQMRWTRTWAEKGARAVLEQSDRKI